MCFGAHTAHELTVKTFVPRCFAQSWTLPVDVCQCDYVCLCVWLCVLYLGSCFPKTDGQGEGCWSAQGSLLQRKLGLPAKGTLWCWEHRCLWTAVDFIACPSWLGVIVTPGVKIFPNQAPLRKYVRDTQWWIILSFHLNFNLISPEATSRNESAFFILRLMKSFNNVQKWLCL